MWLHKVSDHIVHTRETDTPRRINCHAHCWKKKKDFQIIRSKVGGFLSLADNKYFIGRMEIDYRIMSSRFKIWKFLNLLSS